MYIDVPAGIIQDTFYSNDRPQYMNYGAIGTLIGKEINHYFVEIAKTYNYKTEYNYGRKKMCIIEQFYNYTNDVINRKVCVIKYMFLKKIRQRPCVE